MYHDKGGVLILLLFEKIIFREIFICLINIITYKYCYIKYKNMWTNDTILWSIPSEFQTFELCLKVIQLDPFEVWNIKSNIYSYELFMAAVKINGLVLQSGRLDKFIYWDSMQEEINLAAVNQNWKAIEYISWETDEMCRVALLQSLEAAKFIHPFTANEIITSLIEDFPNKYSEKDLIPYEI